MFYLRLNQRKLFRPAKPRIAKLIKPNGLRVSVLKKIDLSTKEISMKTFGLIELINKHILACWTPKRDAFENVSCRD